MRSLRFFSLLLSSLLLITNASTSDAMTNKTLYKFCKPYADRAFDPQLTEDMVCEAYINGAIEYAQGICAIMENAAKENAHQALTRKVFGASQDADLDAVIQEYVNEIKNEPERWGYKPNLFLREVINKIAPCE